MAIFEINRWHYRALRTLAMAASFTVLILMAFAVALSLVSAVYLAAHGFDTDYLASIGRGLYANFGVAGWVLILVALAVCSQWVMLRNMGAVTVTNRRQLLINEVNAMPAPTTMDEYARQAFISGALRATLSPKKFNTFRKLDLRWEAYRSQFPAPASNWDAAGRVPMVVSAFTTDED